MAFKPNPIRTLAKSNKWQTIYYHSRNSSGVKVFENNSDLSEIQIIFLQWLEIYRNLYQDLAIGEEFMSKEVLENEILTDAYLLHKQKKNKKRKSKTKKTRKGLVFGT